MSQPGRLIIADPGLTGPLGHHLGYSAAVAAAALRAGMPATVLAGRGFAGSFPVTGVEAHAVLGTAYQTAGGGGLGRRLMVRILDYAKARGIGEVYGEVMRENRNMIELCRALGFKLAASPEAPELYHVSLRPADWPQAACTE